MRTKGKPDCEPNPNQGSKKAKTRGVRELYREGRPNPWGVQWPERENDESTKKFVRKIKTLFFPTQEARDAKAGELRDLRRSRMMVVSASRAELDEYRAFKKEIGATPVGDVVAAWKSFRVIHGLTPCETTIEKAVEDYLAAASKQVTDGKLGTDTFSQKRHKLNLFVEQFGHLKLDQVNSAQIEEWIDDFDEVRSDQTFDNYLKHIRHFFNLHVAKKEIRENPCISVRRRCDGIGDVEILTVPQTAQLFHTALTYRDANGDATFLPAIGRLAFEAFVGLRFSSGCRLEKKDINFEDRGVLLPKKKLKTKRRHYIDGLPENVWTWLKITPEDCWHLVARQYMELKSQLFVKAGIPHPHNCLRHSFATYHVAAYKDGGKTAYLLCHRNQDQLYEHYKGNATEAKGKEYFTITPQTAPTLAVGFEPASTAQSGVALPRP